MRDFPPTNERRSQGLLTHLRTVTTRALGGSTAKKYAPHTPPETHPVQNSPRAAGPGAHPVQNSPCSAGPSAQPVQNSPNTPKKAHFSQFCPSRENFVPHPPPRPPAGRTLYRAQRQTRYKTLPAQPVRRPNRYKTLPTHPKKPISARFARAGRTMYRFHPHAPQQGELCTAPRAKPGTKLPLLSRSVDPAGTKLSQHAHTSSPPGTKLSQHTAPAAQPVQNSPNTPKIAHFSPFWRSRENFVPHTKPIPVQNSPNTPTPAAQPVQNSPCSADPPAHPVQNSPNTPPPAAHPVQNSPHTPTPAAQPVQNSPNTPKIADFSPFYPSRENFVPLSPPRPPAGRTLYRSHHHDPSRENFLPHPAPNPVQNSPSTPPPAAHPVQNSPNTHKKAYFSPFCPSRENFVPHPSPRPPAGRTLYRTQHHPGTKLAPHTHTSSPTGTKLSQHAQKRPFQPVLPEQGELCTALTITMPSRENFVPRPAPNPVQNSPCSAGPSAQPVQNSPNTPTPAAQPVHNSPSAPVLQRFREKVRPAYPTPQQNREKVRPAHLKTAFFACFAPAGRVLSRTSNQQATLGEFSRAPWFEQIVLAARFTGISY